MGDDLRAAIQAWLDSQGDGWTLAQCVIVMGLERVTDDGVESTPWLWAPPDQPEWITDGLLIAAEQLRDNAPNYDD